MSVSGFCQFLAGYGFLGFVLFSSPEFYADCLFSFQQIVRVGRPNMVRYHYRNIHEEKYCELANEDEKDYARRGEQIVCASECVCVCE